MNWSKNASFADRLSAAAEAKKAQLERAAQARSEAERPPLIGSFLGAELRCSLRPLSRSINTQKMARSAPYVHFPPVLGRGQGCNSSCNPKPKRKGGEHVFIEIH